MSDSSDSELLSRWRDGEADLMEKYGLRFGVSFTTLYVPNGKRLEHADFPMKLAWFDSLAAHFEIVGVDCCRVRRSSEPRRAR